MFARTVIASFDYQEVGLTKLRLTMGVNSLAYHAYFYVYVFKPMQITRW